MSKNDEPREARWAEIQRDAERMRQVHPARRLESESDMLWLVEEVQRLRSENERLKDATSGGNDIPKAQSKAA